MGWFEENKRWITDINAASSENTRIKYNIFSLSFIETWLTNSCMYLGCTCCLFWGLQCGA